MIPMERLPLKYNVSNYGKHYERYTLLDDFQLHKVKRTAIVDKTNTIGWHLTAIFKEGYHPTEDDNAYQRPVTAYTCLLKFQMAIPCKGHEHIARYEQKDGVDSIHNDKCGIPMS